jgi:predicted acyl esterase
LDPAASGEGHRLALRKSAKAAFIPQTVNLADRQDAGWTPSTDLISSSLATHNDVMFVSEPFTKITEVNGVLSGRLDFTVNKMDMDLNIMLYELLADGDYIRLFSPTSEIRASYARDRVHRHLLKAGERQELTFRSERMTSRRLQPGSRLVLVLGINKRPDREINYGTGDDVSEETIADGKIPLKIRWHNDSYVDMPVRRVNP